MQNLLGALGVAGGSPATFAVGLAGRIVSLVSAAVLTYLFGFDKDSEAFDAGDEPTGDKAATPEAAVQAA